MHDQYGVTHNSPVVAPRLAARAIVHPQLRNRSTAAEFEIVDDVVCLRRWRIRPHARDHRRGDERQDQKHENSHGGKMLPNTEKSGRSGFKLAKFNSSDLLEFSLR